MIFITLASSLAVATLPATRSWMNTADTPQERAKKLVGEMTTEEKLELFHGSCGGYTGNVCANSRLGIPQFKYNDGPQGFRGQPGWSTSWPAALTVATAWDVPMMNKWGIAMGEEFYGMGANVQLGPGVCVARVPRNGRNFEYVSGEDPFLGFSMAKAAVSGIQSEGVIANLKHYVNNNQETDRSGQTAVVDERTQYEIYYPPFEGGVAAGLGSVMCSYNKICQNCKPGAIGNWSCGNSDTLVKDLKGNLGFKGYVMSDWGATHSASMNEGLDQEMPGASFMGDTLAGMVKAGLVSMEKVNDSALRILWPYFAVGLFDKNNTNVQHNVTSVAHTQLAKDISAAASVLLQNENGFLPLGKSVKTILVVGKQAKDPIVHGGGSGQVFPDYVSAPLDAIRAVFNIAPIPAPPLPTNNCSSAHWVHGVDFFNTDKQSSNGAKDVGDCCNQCGANPDCNAFTFVGGECWMKGDAKNPKANAAATSGFCAKGPPAPPPPPAADCNTQTGYCVHYSDGSDTSGAAAADAVLYFAGTTSSEGGDRGDLSLGDQDAEIASFAAVAGKKMAVVVVTPGAILTPWRGDVASVITPMMPGQQYGNAIASVLFGSVNPSGKLAISMPVTENDMNITQAMWPGTTGPGGMSSYYAEKLEVGYRWYTAHGVKAAYPFGHGLSYTNFAYSGITVTANSVTVKVANTGTVAGAEVAQLYLGFPATAGEPPKQLKGFSKVQLAAGASQAVTFALDDRSISIWDVGKHAWAKVPGQFSVMVGSSSEDIRATGSFTISGVEHPTV